MEWPFSRKKLSETFLFCGKLSHFEETISDNTLKLLKDKLYSLCKKFQFIYYISYKIFKIKNSIIYLNISKYFWQCNYFYESYNLEIQVNRQKYSAFVS